MEQPSSNNIGTLAWATFNTTISFCSGFIAFIGIGDVQAAGAVIATLVGIVSGILASRYWILSTIEKKQTVKLNNYKLREEETKEKNKKENL